MRGPIYKGKGSASVGDAAGDGRAEDFGFAGSCCWRFHLTPHFPMNGELFTRGAYHHRSIQGIPRTICGRVPERGRQSRQSRMRGQMNVLGAMKVQDAENLLRPFKKNFWAAAGKRWVLRFQCVKLEGTDGRRRRLRRGQAEIRDIGAFKITFTARGADTGALYRAEDPTENGLFWLHNAHAPPKRRTIRERIGSEGQNSIDVVAGPIK